MPKEKLLTVVIPAYNVGPYIGECIQSVLGQQGYESIIDVVVVIDGATDNTFAKIQSAINGHESHVKIIVQDNAGLSAARNVGVDRTTTAYVTFLDGDDIWEPDYLATVIPLLSSGSIDIVEYDARFMDERSNPGKPMKIVSAAAGETVPTDREKFVGRFQCYTWARVYRIGLVRHRPFPVGIRFEDMATTPWYYWHGHRQISIGRTLIGYRQRPNSILKTPSPRDIEDLAKITADAAAMYSETHSAYWQRVTHLVFQQACRRTTWQPLSTWTGSLGIARKAIGSVPPPVGFARWMQVNVTLPYTALLYLKRLLSE